MKCATVCTKTGAYQMKIYDDFLKEGLVQERVFPAKEDASADSATPASAPEKIDNNLPQTIIPDGEIPKTGSVS